MNANTFLTNISKNLHSLEKQSKSLTDDNELKLEEIHKSITDLATLFSTTKKSLINILNTFKSEYGQLYNQPLR